MGFDMFDVCNQDEFLRMFFELNPMAAFYPSASAAIGCNVVVAETYKQCTLIVDDKVDVRQGAGFHLAGRTARFLGRAIVVGDPNLDVHSLVTWVDEVDLNEEPGWKVSFETKRVDNTIWMTKSESIQKECYVCKRTDVKLYKCAVCKSIRYCGKACSRQDWKRHKPQCKASADTTGGSPRV